MIDEIADVALRPNEFQLAIVLVVGASGGLVSLTVGAPPVAVVAAAAVGLVVGVVITAWLTHIAPEGGASNQPGGRGPL